jgi:hypothetical protein
VTDILGKLGAAEIALLISAAAAFLSLLGQIRTFRIASQMPFRALEERTRAIAFWQAWLAAQTAACDAEQVEAAKEVVRQNLSLLVQDVPQTETAEQTPLGTLSRLFLLHPPRQPVGWLFRLPFLLALPASLYLVVRLSEPIVNGTATGRMMTAYFGVLLVIVLVLPGLRLLALLLDRDQRLSGQSVSPAAAIASASEGAT